jgi:CubicO group peptidase (beta-lactamase class C family)
LYSYCALSISPFKNYFSATDAALEGLLKSDLEAIITALLQLDSSNLGDTWADDFLVLKDRKLVLEEYFWGLNKETVYEISSCTKSIGAILVGIALDRG